MKSEGLRYEIGGVMRCCIASLKEWVTENPIVEDGQVVLCQYEDNPKDSGFVLRGDIWKVRLFDPQTIKENAEKR